MRYMLIFNHFKICPRTLPLKNYTNMVKFQACIRVHSTRTFITNVLPHLQSPKIQIHPCYQNRCISSSENKDIKKSVISTPDSAIDIGGGSWQEIYEGLLSTQVKLVKSFSLGTSIIGLSIQPVIINYLGSSLSLVVSFSALIGMFTFITPALIHWFTRKYVFKLRYDAESDLYAATTLSFFLREKTIQFRASDVTIPEIPSMFTTFRVKNKPLFVDMDTFKDVEHFGRIMGYDKPLDLRVDHDEIKKN